MKTIRWVAGSLGLALILLLLVAPWATRSQAAGAATLVEFRSRT